MALDQAKILFKKFVGGVASTNNASPYFNEIAGASSANVTLDRLWMLSQRIPLINPFLPADPDGTTYGASIIPEAVDILEKVVVRLYRIQGTGGATAAYAETVGDVPDAEPVAPGSRRFKDLINSFIYGSDYAIEVRDTGGSVLNIFTPQNDGFIDVDAGLVSFYGSSIYNDTFVDVTAFKYIGPKGDEPGLDIYDKLVNGSTGGGGTGSGITQTAAKLTRVAALPAAGSAYNGLFYLVNDGNGGTPGNPIQINLTFDYGNTWNYVELGPLDDSKQFLSIATLGSFNNNQILQYDHAGVSLSANALVRNDLLYTQSNEWQVFRVSDNNLGFIYTMLDDHYYQYIDSAGGSVLEPKSFEKTAPVEYVLTAANTSTGEVVFPTGTALPARSGLAIEYVENTTHYTNDSDVSRLVNKNSIGLYLNGQKIDIFDSTEEDPTFNGTDNPFDDYDPFIAAFGGYTDYFDIIEGNELGASANQFHIDLTAGTVDEQFFPINGQTQISVGNDIVLTNQILVDSVPQVEGVDFTVNLNLVTFVTPFVGTEQVDINYTFARPEDDFFGVTDPAKNRLLNNYKILFFPEDLDLMDYNEDYYDDQYNISEGDTAYFFFVEITDSLSNVSYRKVTLYGNSGSGDSVEFTYDGSDLSGTTLQTVRLIWFIKPHRLRGNEQLFFLPETAAYEVEIDDEFVVNYAGNLEKSVLVKNNLNNLQPQ